MMVDDSAPSGAIQKYDARLLEAMDAAEDLAAEWAADNARDECSVVMGVGFTHGVDSPIERLFYAAFAPYVVIDRTYSIAPQVRIGRYTADFVVTWTPDERFAPARIVVECDGHDFHEKTKQQAQHDKKRDRYLASQGYTVMRFTGSELWRDPNKCVEEVIDYTQGPYLDSLNEQIVRLNASQGDL